MFTPGGEVVAEFPVEPGSRIGTYDPSGTFLIYVTGAHEARWQGAGQSGSLGQGYFFAAW